MIDAADAEDMLLVACPDPQVGPQFGALLQGRGPPTDRLLLQGWSNELFQYCNHDKNENANL